jgi:hypothetical protein
MRITRITNTITLAISLIAGLGFPGCTPKKNDSTGSANASGNVTQNALNTHVKATNALTPESKPVVSSGTKDPEDDTETKNDDAEKKLAKVQKHEP